MLGSRSSNRTARTSASVTRPASRAQLHTCCLAFHCARPQPGKPRATHGACGPEALDSIRSSDREWSLSNALINPFTSSVVLMSPEQIAPNICHDPTQPITHGVLEACVDEEPATPAVSFKNTVHTNTVNGHQKAPTGFTHFLTTLHLLYTPTRSQLAEETTTPSSGSR